MNKSPQWKFSFPIEVRQRCALGLDLLCCTIRETPKLADKIRFGYGRDFLEDLEVEIWQGKGLLDFPARCGLKSLTGIGEVQPFWQANLRKFQVCRLVEHKRACFARIKAAAVAVADVPVAGIAVADIETAAVGESGIMASAVIRAFVAVAGI